jgi:stage III sporulation protein AG
MQDKNEKEHSFGSAFALLKKIRPKHGAALLIAAGLIGILLIFISDAVPQRASGSAASSGRSALTQTQYADTLRSELEDMIGRISGVGRVRIMVTVGSDNQSVYEQSEKTTGDAAVTSQSDGGSEKQSSSASERSPVVLDNGSGGQSALIKTTLRPQILGIAVVCDGGDDPEVQEKITNTLVSILDITSEHISVCKMSAK